MAVSCQLSPLLPRHVIPLTIEPERLTNLQSRLSNCGHTLFKIVPISRCQLLSIAPIAECSGQCPWNCITTDFCNLDLLLSRTSSPQHLFGNNVYLADSIWVSLFVVHENVNSDHRLLLIPSFDQKILEGFALFHQKGMVRPPAVGFCKNMQFF